MGELRQLTICLPEGMLEKIDRLAARQQYSRSELVYEAMDAYITRYEHEMMLECMRRGYQEMAPINLSLAEEGLVD